MGRQIKTLLINPPFTTESIYGKFAGAGADHAPLSLGYIAAYLLKHGKDVKIIDAAKLKLDIVGISKMISAYSPDIVGLHTCTPNINTVKLLASEIKNLSSDILVIAGGPHFLYNPAEEAKNSKLDIIVIGEGEGTCLEIVEGLEQGNLGQFISEISPRIRGIVYKDNNTVKINSPRDPIVDIDSIPFPARHLLPPLHTYRSTIATFKRLPSTIVLTSRGCPFSCIYCHNSAQRIKFRMHSIGYVMEEVDELINKYKIKDITFVDDIFTVDRDRTFAICKELAKRKDRLCWVCNIKVGLVDKEMLKVLKDSGCWLVMFGVDSGNQGIIDTMERKFALEEAEQVCNWCRDIGLMIHPNFIIGNPGETVEAINESINFARKIYCHYPVFMTMVPYPGTKLWDNLHRYGRLATDNFDRFTFGSEKPCFIPYGLTEGLIIRKRKEAYLKCYLNFPMVLRHICSIKSFEDIRRLLRAFRVLIGI